MHVHTEENTPLSLYLDALTPQAKIDTPWIRELDEIEPAEAAAMLPNSSGQGPKVNSLALPMGPCQLPVSTPHILNESVDIADLVSTASDETKYNSHLLWVLEISSNTCKDGAFTIATNARLQEATIIMNGGDHVEVVALVDDGVSRNVMDVGYFEEIEELLGELEEGEDLVGAGGNRLPTCGAWRGKVETGGVVKWANWEIIDLGGSAKMILGRPWLRDVGAVHNYLTDVIHIKGDDGEKELQLAQVDHRRIEEVVMGQASEAEHEVQLKSPSAQQDKDSTPSRTTAIFLLFGHAHCRTSSHWAALAVEMDDDEGDAGEDEETARESRDETPVLKEFLDEVLCLGEVYEARWRMTRSERRKKTRVKRAKIAERLGALSDKMLAEAETILAKHVQTTLWLQSSHTETTANALDDDTLKLLFVSVQQNSINLCVRYAIEYT